MKDKSFDNFCPSMKPTFFVVGKISQSVCPWKALAVWSKCFLEWSNRGHHNLFAPRQPQQISLNAFWKGKKGRIIYSTQQGAGLTHKHWTWLQRLSRDKKMKLRPLATNESEYFNINTLGQCYKTLILPSFLCNTTILGYKAILPM